MLTSMYTDRSAIAQNQSATSVWLSAKLINANTNKSEKKVFWSKRLNLFTLKNHVIDFVLHIWYILFVSTAATFFLLFLLYKTNLPFYYFIPHNNEYIRTHGVTVAGCQIGIKSWVVFTLRTVDLSYSFLDLILRL